MLLSKKKKSFCFFFFFFALLTVSERDFNRPSLLYLTLNPKINKLQKPNEFSCLSPSFLKHKILFNPFSSLLSPFLHHLRSLSLYEQSYASYKHYSRFVRVALTTKKTHPELSISDTWKERRIILNGFDWNYEFQI